MFFTAKGQPRHKQKRICQLLMLLDMERWPEEKSFYGGVLELISDSFPFC